MRRRGPPTECHRDELDTPARAGRWQTPKLQLREVGLRQMYGSIFNEPFHDAEAHPGNDATEAERTADAEVRMGQNVTWTVKPFIDPQAWAVLTNTAPPEKVCEIPDGPGAYKKALLIAAAPELLEALEAFQDAAESWHNFHHGSELVECDEICAQISKGRSAIAKAEGIYEPGRPTANERTSDPSPQPAAIQKQIEHP